MRSTPNTEAAGTIVARDLALTYRDGTEAVRGVNIDVPQGAIFGFLGPNGAGKSTTVRMLTTLLAPSSGSAQVSGIDVARDPRRVRQTIGVALQESGLNGMSTGFELLEMHARLQGLRPKTAITRAQELLEVVGLTDAADRRALRYSGGMKRRLDLAIALVHRPSVLFLDEPTTGLDPASRFVIWDQVRRLRTEQGTTVFLTTQYLDEADQLADTVAIIKDGRIAVEGTPAELKLHVASDTVLITVAPGPDLPSPVAIAAELAQRAEIDHADFDEQTSQLVVRCADGEAQVPMLLGRIGIPVTRVSVTAPSLDDVFMAVTEGVS
jgi:ABC-2 type transport system ATP-binding protein